MIGPGQGTEYTIINHSNAAATFGERDVSNPKGEYVMGPEGTPCGRASCQTAYFAITNDSTSAAATFTVRRSHHNIFIFRDFCNFNTILSTKFHH